MSSYPSKKVALAIRVGVPHLEDMIHGILRYARCEVNWQLTMSYDYWPAISARSLRGWPGDGIIAGINSISEAEALIKLGLPIVNVSNHLADAGIPRVTADGRAVGRLAAEHLLECGFRQFAYFGMRGHWFSDECGSSFFETVENAGGKYSKFYGLSARSSHRVWTEHEAALDHWIDSLMIPTGLLACHDYRARQVLAACERLGLHVPDDIAVMGVNNDQVACEYFEPQLTSISRNGEQVGFEAARLLDKMMAGAKPNVGNILIPPLGVVKRHSTNIIAIEDRNVAKAVRLIRERLGEPIILERLAADLDISRRSLERAFRNALGQTPHDYISQTRVQRAKQILVDERKLSMSEIARRCGFTDEKHFRMVFHRLTGNSPRRYRYQNSRKATQMAEMVGERP